MYIECLDLQRRRASSIALSHRTHYHLGPSSPRVHHLESITTSSPPSPRVHLHLESTFTSSPPSLRVHHRIFFIEPAIATSAPSPASR
ncbi:hypothetical protein Vi05172_g8095 [Venturia inaequalis]|nr:hypothetical protein Vi05172_g8095 [Venturia inaequalis]